MSVKEKVYTALDYTKDKLQKSKIPEKISGFYDFISKNPKYIGFLFFTLVYFIVYIYFLFNPGKFLNEYFWKKYNKYTNFSNFVLTIGLFLLILSSLFKTYNKFTGINNFSEQFKKSLQYLSLIFVIFIFIVGIVYALGSSSFIATTAIIILNIFIFTLLYKYVLKDLISNSKFRPLFDKLLFIPLSILSWFKTTESSIFIFLGLEIFIILGYFLYPLLKEKTISRKGKLLIKKPLYTNYKKTIGGYFELNEDTSNEYNYHYTLSSWFFFHERPPNTNKNYSKYTTVLNYGNKPKIMYNPEIQKVKILMKQGTNELKTVYVGELLLQKWNNIVITYDRGSLDVFINGKLVSSTPNIVPYMEYDTIDIGEIRGIDGGVTNIVYYPNVLPYQTIVKKYNMLKKNPVL